jgi:hypothetical protein
MSEAPTFEELIHRVRAWEQAAITAQVGGNAGSLHRKLARAIDRVVDDLGLDDEP